MVYHSTERPQLLYIVHVVFVWCYIASFLKVVIILLSKRVRERLVVGFSKRVRDCSWVSDDYAITAREILLQRKLHLR